MSALSLDNLKHNLKKTISSKASKITIKISKI